MPNIIVIYDDQEIRLPVSYERLLRFEQAYGSGSMKEFYALLVDPSNDHTDVARKYGVSRERVRQIYNKYVLPFLPESLRYSRGERRRQYTKSRPHGELADCAIRVRQAAEEQGIRVSHVNRVAEGGGVYTRKKLLSLNGKQCDVRAVTNCTADAWARLNLYVDEVLGTIDFVIAVVQVSGYPEKFFMLSLRLIGESHFGTHMHNGRPMKQLYLPLKQWYEYPQDLKIDWRSYENAWHFFTETPSHHA